MFMCFEGYDSYVQNVLNAVMAFIYITEHLLDIMHIAFHNPVHV